MVRSCRFPCETFPIWFTYFHLMWREWHGSEGKLVYTLL